MPRLFDIALNPRKVAPPSSLLLLQHIRILRSMSTQALEDVTQEMGPTEVCGGSHELTNHFANAGLVVDGLPNSLLLGFLSSLLS